MCWRKKIPTENHIYLNMREQWWRYLKLYKFCYAKRYKVTGPTLYNSLMENPHFWHGSFFFLIMLGSIWDLGSQTRNGTHAHCSISMESYPLDHQESPWHGSLVPHWSEVKIAQSCLTLCDPMDYTVHDSPDQNTGVGRLSLLQRIFPTQGLNPDLPQCRQILYQLSHKGSYTSLRITLVQ